MNDLQKQIEHAPDHAECDRSRKLFLQGNRKPEKRTASFRIASLEQEYCWREMDLDEEITK